MQALRKRLQVDVLVANAVMVVAGCATAAWSQDIRLGEPATSAFLHPEGGSSEGEYPPPYNRVTQSTGSLPFTAASGEDIFRPEFPDNSAPYDRSDLHHQNSEPSVSGAPIQDWNLIDAGAPGARVQLQVLPSDSGMPLETTHTLGCSTCGSTRLYNRALRPGERFSSGLLAALCSCDQCYQPKWDLQQSAAFFIDSARPQTRTRFGWDYGTNMLLADRAEYFWARSGQLGPSPAPYTFIVPEFDYHQLSMYTEVANGGFSFFTTLPYRSLYLDQAGHEAGFSDISLGTKSLIHDSPILQISFQMTTYIPTAQSSKGLGTGHVSLEPSLLFALRLSRFNLLQAQLAEWIPIGGDPDYAGAMARWGISWNRLAWSLDETTQMTTNLELFGYSFQDGAFTDPLLGPFQSAGDASYVYFGPGCRFLFCNKWEFGFAGAFALTEPHFAESLVRSELTMRF